MIGSSKFVPFIARQIVRRPARSALTLSGIAAAMFLFAAVQAMQSGVRSATERSARDAKLIVYREDRYCPFTSRLPEDYATRIARLPGVASAVPMKVVVSNCRASLDVITYRGVPPEGFEQSMMGDITLVAGSLEEWRKRGDGALVGERLAARRDLKPGDSIAIGGITVTVAGIISSPHPQDQNVAYTHLEYLQRTGGSSDGVVTQFTVEVSDPEQLESVAASIDQLFENAQDPTATWSEKEFATRAISDLIEIVGFARLLGWGALAAVFALVANAIILSVQERVKEHAVLQTLGFGNRLIAGLIVAESALLSLLGGAVGLVSAALFLWWGAFSLSVEGMSVNIQSGGGALFVGLLLCSTIGVLAGLVPAWQASRHDIAGCFRAV
jgi:putative ABC transport system permease protein